MEHSENFGERGRLKYRHEREKNEASVDPFLTGKKRKGRSNGGGERTGRNSERRGWLCHAGFPHIHGSGPTSRCINIARASAARRFPQRCWLWETGEARGPVDMWETCRRARISVVDRWGVEQQPERKRCEHRRCGSSRRARLGGRRSRSAQFNLRTGWVVRAGRRQRNGAGDAQPGDCAKKARGRELGALTWSGRRPRRWRPPCSSYAMRALRLGGWSAPGGGRGMARATPGAATAGKTRERRLGARGVGPRPRRWRPPCWSCAMRALRSG